MEENQVLKPAFQWMEGECRGCGAKMIGICHPCRRNPPKILAINEEEAAEIEGWLMTRWEGRTIHLEKEFP